MAMQQKNWEREYMTSLNKIQLNYGAESDLQLYKLKIMELKIIEAVSYSKIQWNLTNWKLWNWFWFPIQTPDTTGTKIEQGAARPLNLARQDFIGESL